MNIILTKKKMCDQIDVYVARFYSPIWSLAEGPFQRWLEGLEEGGVKDAMINIGSKIPQKCWFKQKFNLNFTPCMLNPLFPILMQLSIFAREEASHDFLLQSLAELDINMSEIEQKIAEIKTNANQDI